MALSEIFELLFPSSCIHCGESGSIICSLCENQIARTSKSFYLISGIPLFAPLRYDQITSQLILAAKEENLRSASKYLAQAIATKFEEIAHTLPFKEHIFVPIPSSRRADRRRGFAHTQLLTCLLVNEINSRALHTAKVVSLLRPIRHLSDQTLLNAKERAVNLRGAFGLDRNNIPKALSRGSGAPPKMGIILVDDLVTTGSTMSEGARALGEGGLVVEAALSACVAGRFLVNKIGP